MKKIISVILILSALITLCSCSGGAVKVSQTEECIPSNCQEMFEEIILESENGYYFRVIEDWQEKLKYYDKASGEVIICCSKPECMHDGNEYCAATSGKYLIQSMAMYDGAVYAVMYTAFETDTLEFKLVRIEPDGTARSEVCTFLTLKNAGAAEADFMDKIILHKGKAFVDYSYSYVTSDGWAVGSSYYGKVMIDLSTGEYSEVPLPDGVTRDNIIHTARTSRVDGNWLYNVITTDEDKLNHFSIYRWNFVTGEYQKLDVPQVVSSYTVNDGIVYYTVVDRTDIENKTVQIYRHFPDTGVTEKFTESSIPEENVIETSIIGGNNNAPEVTTDREYIYYINYGLCSVINSAPNSKYCVQPECIIYSFDGDELARFTLPITPTTEFEAYYTNIVNGTVYYHQSRAGDVYCCSVEDILAGKVEWTKLYYAY